MSKRAFALHIAAALALGAALTTTAAPAQTAAAPSPACEAQVGGLTFICGVTNPEDLLPVPGTKWMIASGYNPGGGLPAGQGVHLIDTAAKTASPFYKGEAARARPRDAQCGAPPPATLETHGLYLTPEREAGSFTLYAVSHAPRESVEIFALDASGAAPKLAWTGCRLMPEGMRGNGVAVLGDGAILVTVLNAPGRAAADGSSRGVVLALRPGEKAFTPLAGTELQGNNGIEVSKDKKEFYVVAFGEPAVYVFSAADTRAPLRSVKAPGFVPDNLRWSGDLLIGTGPMYDEPLCGGTRREAQAVLGEAGRKPGGGCNRGYVAAALDPVKMTWKILAYAEPNPQIGIISAGVITDDTLWIGAALSPGLAYRTLPRPR